MENGQRITSVIQIGSKNNLKEKEADIKISRSIIYIPKLPRKTQVSLFIFFKKDEKGTDMKYERNS